MFVVKNSKSEQHHWILHIRISLGTRFQLNLTILIFRTRFAQKRYFWSKAEEVNTTIEFSIFKLVYSQYSTQRDNFDFLDQICPKRYFQSKTEQVFTIHHHQGILHIWISQGTKFQLKVIILKFWTKFIPERYFQWKTEQAFQGLQAFAFFDSNR